MSHAIHHGYNRTYKSTVGTGVPDCPSYVSRHTVWLYAFDLASLAVFLCFLSPPERKDQRKCYCLLRCKILSQNRERFIKRNGIVTSFALFLLRQLLEMRCRLRRCTYTSQNLAIAPQAACGLLTYTVLKAFASRSPCLRRGVTRVCAPF